jgi:hypothetical protein
MAQTDVRQDGADYNRRSANWKDYFPAFTSGLIRAREGIILNARASHADIKESLCSKILY